jgi:hypothetical protein
MCSGWTPSSTGRARSLSLSLSLRCAPMALQGTRRYYTRRASTPLSDRFNLRFGQDPPARSDRGEGFKFPHVFTTFHWNMAMYEPQADHFDSSKTLPFVGGLRLSATGPVGLPPRVDEGARERSRLLSARPLRGSSARQLLQQAARLADASTLGDDECAEIARDTAAT